MGYTFNRPTVLESVSFNYGHWKYLNSLDGLRIEQDDLALCKKNCEAVSLGPDTKNVEKILEFKQLTTVHLVSPSKKTLNLVEQCEDLKSLSISQSRIRDISVFDKLFKACPNLEELSLYSCTAFKNLEPLRHLHKLKSLLLDHIRHIDSLDTLSVCKELEYLDISYYMKEFKYSVNDLNGIQSLSKLKFLNLESIDEVRSAFDIKTWPFLKNLRYIALPDISYAIRDIAFLAKNYPDIEGSPILPYTATYSGTEEVHPDDGKYKLSYSQFADKYPNHMVTSFSRRIAQKDPIKIVSVRFYEEGRKSIFYTDGNLPEDIMQKKMREEMSNARKSLLEAIANF